MEAVDTYRDLNLNSSSLYVFYKTGKEAIKNKKMNKLENRIRVVCDDDSDYSPFLIQLKETNSSSYKNLKKMLRVAYKRKMRENRYN